MKNALIVAPQSAHEAMQLATMLSQSSLVPKDYSNKPEDTLVAMMLGSELGMNPIQSLRNISVINGRPSIWGDAIPALIQNHPSYGGMEESFDDGTMTATCTVWRKGGPRHTQTFSQADAERAGLWTKGGPWKQYPKRMLQMRARGFAVRDQFADALAGLITREEAMDLPEERDITPRHEEPAGIEHSDSEVASERDELLQKVSGLIAAKQTSEESLCQTAGVKTLLELPDQRLTRLIGYLEGLPDRARQQEAAA
jgi:hypothetical protein